MDTTAIDIRFDRDGICNYCTEYLENVASRSRAGDIVADREAMLAKVRRSGKGKQYDCAVGVSGGVDSSYVLYTAAKQGLRVLAVHLDTGWNSELASHNIATLVNALGVDLYTHVIDWKENRDLQLSFFKAHVVDIELLMDNAMFALNYQKAAEYGLTYILAGTNFATEGLRLPSAWNHSKFDVANIKAIHRRFGSLPIRTHPLISTMGRAWYECVRGIKWISLLNYYSYNKFEALETLTREVGYKPYPYKHYESVFTRFYQAYILPRKFGYDKRRVHLSSLVASGQMSRDDALELLRTPAYADPQQEEQDRRFVMKKLGFTEDSFAAYMRAPAVPHARYGSELAIYRPMIKLYNAVARSIRA